MYFILYLTIFWDHFLTDFNKILQKYYNWSQQNDPMYRCNIIIYFPIVECLGYFYFFSVIHCAVVSIHLHKLISVSLGTLFPYTRYLNIGILSQKFWTFLKFLIHIVSLHFLEKLNQFTFFSAMCDSILLREN